MYGFRHVLWALSQNRNLLVTSIRVVSLLHPLAYLAGRITVQIKGFMTGLLLLFLLWYDVEYFLPVLKMLEYMDEGLM